MNQQIERALQKKMDAEEVRQQTLTTLKSGTVSGREYDMLLDTLEQSHELLKNASYRLDLLSLVK